MLRVPAVVAAVPVLAFAFVGSAYADPPPRDRYIVVLDDSASPRTVAHEHGLQPDLVYHAALNGFAGTVPAGRLDGLTHDPRVDYVEPDGVAQAVTTQTGATWGLDRIDERTRPLDGSYSYTSTGAGVNAYVIDTGIRTTHNEFGGRATRSAAADFVSTPIGGDDCNGHGTHVAGTIGGSTYGVAKDVSLYAVRVLDCQGSGDWSWVIAGIDWVTAHHAAGQPAVANMSLGGSATSSVDAAVSNSIADGVTYAIAAGNSGANACNYTPARVASALTIGATDSTDTRASWSNYGSCVDWFAPGVSITSAWKTSDTATNTISGTSMATPHTAGAAALYLQDHPSASPATVRSGLFSALTTGVVASSNSTNNHLLYVGPSDIAEPVPPPPSGGFSLGANGYKVKGLQKADLAWSGSSATSFDVFRDGAKLATVGGSAYTDNINRKGGGASYTYRVCEAGTSTCSNESTVAF